MEKDKQLLFSPLFLKYQADFEKNPRSRVFAPLAEIYRKIGMTEKAMEILSQGIRFHPTYVMGYVGLAFCYYDLRQFNLTYTTLRPFIEENRDNLRLQKLYADTCLSLSKKDEALETLKYLLFINPRDKEIAAFVTKLEEEIESAGQSHHKPIVIPEEYFKPEPNEDITFPTEKLKSKPTQDFDDWKTLNLEPNTKLELVKPQSNWHMQSGIALELDDEPKLLDANEDDYGIENEKNYGKEYKDNYDGNLSDLAHETVSELNPSKHIDTTPFMTHTLVDLYCGQGHLEKALEILEKILILNPNDQRTIEKKNEIQNLISPQNNEYPDPLVDAEPDDFKLEADDELETSEEDGRKELMDLIDERVNVETLPIALVPVQKPDTKALEKKYQNFLKKIQKRALDYQARF